MPHVTVKMYPGTTDAEKGRIAQEITRILMEVAQKPEAAVSIDIVEIDASTWMETVYENEIRANLGRLQKKPGY